MNEFSLEGKSALVTGGGRGIGKAIALLFAEAGADVAVSARTLEQLQEATEEIRGLGKKSIAIQADVSDSGQVNEMVRKATEGLGKIDIMVNNAGIGKGGPVTPLPDEREGNMFKPGSSQSKGPSLVSDYSPNSSMPMTDETWHQVMDINLSSVFYCCRAVAPQMLERGYGKIINISSTSAVLAGAYGAPYQTSKAGMNMLTKTLANEWARYNITVNGIGPGWFITEMTELGFNDPDTYKRRVESLPLKRLTDLRDLGLLAVYLASPASDWMTGQVIYLDGGETAIFN